MPWLDANVLEEYKQWRTAAVLLYQYILAMPLAERSFSLAWDNQRSDLLWTGLRDTADPSVSALQVSKPSRDNPFQIHFEHNVSTETKPNVIRPGLKHDKIACKMQGPEILIIDPSNDFHAFQLEGHDKTGFGLEWSPFDSESIVSSSEDSTVCLFDIESGGFDLFKGHEEPVDAVAWDAFDRNVFVSGSDDGTICLWDRRICRHTDKVLVGNLEVSSISFSPHTQFQLASASANGRIEVWDTRGLRSPKHSISSIENPVQVSWSPHFKDTFLVSAKDLVSIFNLNCLFGKSKELLFIHGGHVDMVREASWHPDDVWTIASVDDSSVLHVWKVACEITEGI